MKIQDESSVKRLGIFFFYDAEGVVDDYIPTLLNGFRPYLSEMTIVCNGKLNEAGEKILSSYTNNLIVRPNEGFDVWAYKTAMESYGWEKLVSFDEVVLFNATIMVLSIRSLKCLRRWISVIWTSGVSQSSIKFHRTIRAQSLWISTRAYSIPLPRIPSKPD